LKFVTCVILISYCSMNIALECTQIRNNKIELRE